MAKGPTFIQRSRAVSASEKAAYHQVSGAGKRRVKREFFGLSRQDEAAIVAVVDAAITRRLRASS